jgi:hypothetical protein
MPQPNPSAPRNNIERAWLVLQTNHPELFPIPADKHIEFLHDDVLCSRYKGQLCDCPVKIKIGNKIY